MTDDLPELLSELDPTAPLRAHGIEDLLDLIPSLLGFHPTESLVAMLIDGGRVRVTARLDLADAAEAGRLAGAFQPLLARFPTASWLVAAYTPDADAAWASLDLVDALLPWELGVWVVHVGADRWFCTPDDPGAPYDPGCSALAAEAAYRGIRVLPDRSEIARSLEPTIDAGELDRVLDQVITVPPEATVRRALGLATAKMRAGGGVTLEEAAVLAVAAFSPAFAEAIVTGIDRGTAPQACALWTEVVRSTSAFAGAAAAVILGVAAWVAGEGALQNVCLDRAEPFLADSQWFRFLDFVNRVALPPCEWEGVRLDLLRGAGAA